MPVFLKEITPRNILSFGPDTKPIELGPLNILIGPNGSGKSNLIEVIDLARSSPTGFDAIFKPRISDWIWKGGKSDPISIDLKISYPIGKMPLRHILEIQSLQYGFVIDDEQIENELPYPGKDDVYFYYRNNGANAILNIQERRRKLNYEDIDQRLSILAQRYDPEVYPEISWLSYMYKRIRIFKDWNIGRTNGLRRPQEADSIREFLLEDFSNFNMFLNPKFIDNNYKNKVLKYMKELNDGIVDILFSIAGGTVELFISERAFSIPSNRLSDGTLRFFFLVALLCDDNPPPLICIEEPEIGMHPDMIHILARLLEEASERTQLIITTHSTQLIDSFTDTPEVVLVCEKEDQQTQIKRLDAERLKPWLEKYSLGTLWTQGSIGGVRW